MKFFTKKTDKEYIIDISKIKVRSDFLQTQIGQKKWLRKLNYFKRTGEFESKIILSQDNLLLDGYSTYLIAKEFGLDKVPVWYV